MEKRIGGTLTNWQVHTLNFTPEEMEKAYPGADALPMMITAIVKDDPTGRWTPGYHMRTSCVVKLYLQTGLLETVNTIYRLEGEPGDPFFPDDLGNGVLNIFY